MIPQSSPGASYQTHRHAIDDAIKRVLESGWYILGKEVEAFEREFATAMGAAWAIGVANGTDAIELAMRALGVSASDGVLTVSHTAVATAAAIGRIGARPFFVDIDPRRYTMDPASLEAALRTEAGSSAKAIIVVHLYGMPADLPAIIALAKKHRIPVIEDCAQAHGAALHGQKVGTWGDLACFSFYPTKNLGALGDGGAVTGKAPELAERVRLLREYGWRSRYVSETFGFNSRLDELQAAILREKLRFLDEENQRRRNIASRYRARLASSTVHAPAAVPDATQVFHQFVIETQDRESLRASLREAGIATLVHYPLAVHQQPAYDAQELRLVPLPCTEAAIARILSLPMYPELQDAQVDEIANAILRWRPSGEH